MKSIINLVLLLAITSLEANVYPYQPNFYQNLNMRPWDYLQRHYLHRLKNDYPASVSIGGSVGAQAEGNSKLNGDTAVETTDSSKSIAVKAGNAELSAIGNIVNNATAAANTTLDAKKSDIDDMTTSVQGNIANVTSGVNNTASASVVSTHSVNIANTTAGANGNSNLSLDKAANVTSINGTRASADKKELKDGVVNATSKVEQNLNAVNNMSNPVNTVNATAVQKLNTAANATSNVNTASASVNATSNAGASVDRVSDGSSLNMGVAAKKEVKADEGFHSEFIARQRARAAARLSKRFGVNVQKISNSIAARLRGIAAGPNLNKIVRAAPRIRPNFNNIVRVRPNVGYIANQMRNRYSNMYQG